ncbi:MAG: PEP-CTERM sorting domain-containing protein [Acidobacteria bacterium]|nr:PEP-CTERM sorting domain-containing protein [Acidobacteriota bacterium]
MRHQALRPAALMLSVLLITSAPAKAGTIEFADMAQANTDGRNARPASELRLRVMSQSGQLAADTQSPQGGSTSSTDQSNGTSTATQTGSATPSTDVTLTQSGGQVETVDLGDVTGTVCDCGEIPAPRTPGGGFPKWPFLALAGIPLAFIHKGGEDTPPNTPPNPPPQTPVPEPATLLLFGTGLLALGSHARRRHASKLASIESIATAGEV